MRLSHVLTTESRMFARIHDLIVLRVHVNSLMFFNVRIFSCMCSHLLCSKLYVPSSVCIIFRFHASVSSYSRVGLLLVGVVLPFSQSSFGVVLLSPLLLLGGRLSTLSPCAWCCLWVCCSYLLLREEEEEEKAPPPKEGR